MMRGHREGIDRRTVGVGRGGAEAESRGLVDALWRAARLSEQRAAAQLARLGQLSGRPDGVGDVVGSAGGPDSFWVTAEALRRRHWRERRLLVAAAALAAELWQWAEQTPVPPAPPVPPDGPGGPDGGGAGRGTEWGRTDVALEYWMRQEGWRSLAGADELAETHAALAASAGGARWCVHCGRPVHELRLFIREGWHRAFSRCGACGLVVELRPGTALAAVGAAVTVPQRVLERDVGTVSEGGDGRP
jgi:hypothetical protein